jgi:hypothetical protein
LATSGFAANAPADLRNLHPFNLDGQRVDVEGE